MAVGVLIIRGAFSVNLNDIGEFIHIIPPLTLGSCFIEAAFGSLGAFYIGGFPTAWAVAVGCLTAAMSGSAVTPYLQEFEEKIKTDNNTSSKAKETLAIAKAACGLDAVVAIFMTEVAFGFMWGTKCYGEGILLGLFEVLGGICFGVIWGSCSGFYVEGVQGKLFAITVMSLMGLTKIGYPRGGPLAVYSGALVAITIWRQRQHHDIHFIVDNFKKSWFIFQPILFGILGSRIDLKLVNWDVIYNGVICLIITVLGRCGGSLLMTYRSGLSYRERLFLTLCCWVGKGTMQAALCPVPFDTAISLGRFTETQELATDVMNLVTMNILITSIQL